MYMYITYNLHVYKHAKKFRHFVSQTKKKGVGGYFGKIGYSDVVGV